MASLTRCPEFEITPEEAKKLATASANVASHYNIAIDPKYVAWAQLYGAIGSIHFTRLMAIKVRRAAERAEAAEAAQRAREEAGNVVDIQPQVGWPTHGEG